MTYVISKLALRCLDAKSTQEMNVAFVSLILHVRVFIMQYQVNNNFWQLCFGFVLLHNSLYYDYKDMI